jgi:hypothetical protein
MDSSLSSRLGALRESNAPISSLRALSILAPFLYKLSFPEPGNDSLRIQTIHYLLETYYVKYPRTDTLNVDRSYCASGHTVCYSCGSVLGSGTCGITSSCGECQAAPSLTSYLLIDLLDHCYKIPPAVTVKVISDYLGSRYYERHS